MYDTLIDSKVLFEQLEDPAWCVIDCRASLTDPTAGSTAYAAGHIPGALFADLATDLSGPLIPGVTGRHPLPDAAHARRHVRTLGHRCAHSGGRIRRRQRRVRRTRLVAVSLARSRRRGSVERRSRCVAGRRVSAAQRRRASRRRRAFPVRATLTRVVSVAEVIDRARLHGSGRRTRGSPFSRRGRTDRPGGRPHSRRALPAVRRQPRAATAASRHRSCFAGASKPARTPRRNWSAIAGRASPRATTSSRCAMPDCRRPRCIAGSFSEWIRDPARPVER